ncbi:MAG: hypothetical protein NT070_23115 [Cyanobacteria bacterium]|nr:hypothetical protein [Cyanobacteriota bacterium]
MLKAFPFLLIPFLALPVNATIVQTLPSDTLQGENALPRISLPLGHTVNLNFIPSGEIVRQVHLDDRSRVVVSFDSPLCPPNATGDCRAGATVIYLRQISKPIAFSSRAIASYGAEGYSNSMMTLITTRPDGSNRKLYQFELRYLNGSTAIRTIQITSNAPRFPPIARTVQSSSQSQIQRIRSGLAIATARNLILPDSAIRKPLKQFFQLIDSGSSFENAITQSEIPPEFLDWLQTLMP